MNLLCIALFGIFASTESETFISPAVLSEGDVGACPSSDSLESLKQTAKEEIATALQNITNCPCGGSGQWTNIANFNFSDPDVACPSNFTLLTTPVRGCKRAPGQGPVCISAVFSSRGQSYSRVCGRVNGYQKGTTDAFYLSAGLRTLEQIYVEGVSLTHGTPGSRQHIWTFVAALYETASPYNPNSNCPCTNAEEDWPLEVHSYVGNNYFCATGNPGPGFTTGSIVYADDPLWDGEGCGPTNACCQFNKPPWFCTTLPHSTTDDIEMRLCSNQGEENEDVVISFVNINIM